MAFNLSTPSGTIPIQSRLDNDSNYRQEVAVSPARWTGVSPAEKLSVNNAAVTSLTPPATATHAVLCNETNSIRWYDTGDTPTTANGMLLPAGEYLELDMANFAQFKMIAVATTSTVQIVYRRYGT